ncbi:protein NLRC3-like [Apis cerana]|nr:protein NLRC3-like [Apis cerana]
MFPIPDDPGLVPAFWTIQERRPSYADDGIMKFFDLVKTFYMRPIQAMEDMLRTNKINLQYYGLDSRIIKPLSEALMKNPTVNTINLTGNWLSEDACYHLNELLLKNNIIHTLLLSGCKIGANGVAKLYDGIFTNETLKKLDLSDCNLRKEGIDYLVQAICNNESIETLLLNHNHLDESCSDALQKLVNCSKTIKHLELSWNSLYTTETWKKFIRGFEENETLLDLDLSWNALGKECISYLRRLLLRSLILKKLHLNGNRFTNDDVSVIARALSRNATLEELYIGDNPFKADGAFALVKAITPEKSSESQLRILDLTNIWANKNIIPELETIQNSKPWVDIRLGGIFSNYKIEGPDVKAILLKRANYEAMKPKKKRRRKNFGHFVLSLSDDLISKGKFLELVQNFQLNLSKSLLNELMIAFTGIKNTVDQGLLKSVYMKQYPNTKLPTEKPKKIKSKKRKIKKKEIKETNEEENL